MKTVLAFAAVAALAIVSSPADAKGCLKGAAVGGVAGHYAGHHGLLGAAAGCLYGRHRANEQDARRRRRAIPATRTARCSARRVRFGFDCQTTAPSSL